MRRAEKLGVYCGVAGLTLGAFMGASPIVQGTANGHLTAQEAGLYAGMLGAILGMSSALLGAWYGSRQR